MRPGRTAKDARRERALERLEDRIAWLRRSGDVPEWIAGRLDVSERDRDSLLRKLGREVAP